MFLSGEGENNEGIQSLWEQGSDLSIYLSQSVSQSLMTQIGSRGFLILPPSLPLPLSLQVGDEGEMDALCAEISSQYHSGESPDSPGRPCCTFTYVTMTGEEVELCQGGHNIAVR